MKNRAKCKKCESIIESKFDGDYVSCKCGEISVSGGNNFGCAAADWANFFRVDDVGNIIIPVIKETPKVTKADFLYALDDMIKRIEDMPPNAMVVAINHYDFVSVLILLSNIFRFDLSESN